MARTDQAVHVEGLRELNLALSTIDPQLRKNLNKRLLALAARMRDDIRAVMPSRSGRARMSVKAGRSATAAYVSAGKKQVPYVAWLDFGGELKPTGKRKGTQVRPIVKGGRYMYPTVARNADKTQAEALKAFEETKAELGLD